MKNSTRFCISLNIINFSKAELRFSEKLGWYLCFKVQINVKCHFFEYCVSFFVLFLFYETYGDLIKSTNRTFDQSELN